MSKITKITTFILMLIYAVGIANAFGYFRNYDMYDFMGMPGFGMFVGFGIIAMLVGIFLFLFWLFMLVDCLKRDFKNGYEKIAWILVMIFLHILGAIIYYFVVKIGEKEQKNKKK